MTDLIFDNVHRVNAQADLDPETIRISVDTKATINIGDYSRGGKSRGLEPVKAADHDMAIKQKLVPGGILETDTGKPFLFFTESHKTSDFLVDGLQLWWDARKEVIGAAKRLVVNLDNGPECNGRRSRFLQRMADFSDQSGLEIHLAYYPPYHSKYNAIERYWAGLEKSWNGYLLSTVDTVISRAGNFCWKGMRTIASLMDAVYEKGVKIGGSEKRDLEHRLERSTDLQWWDITIHPKTVLL